MAARNELVQARVPGRKPLKRLSAPSDITITPLTRRARAPSRQERGVNERRQPKCITRATLMLMVQPQAQDGSELFGIDRLGQIIRGAGGDALFPVAFHGLGGDGDDGQMLKIGIDDSNSFNIYLPADPREREAGRYFVKTADGRYLKLREEPANR